MGAANTSKLVNSVEIDVNIPCRASEDTGKNMFLYSLMYNYTLAPWYVHHDDGHQSLATYPELMRVRSQSLPIAETIYWQWYLTRTSFLEGRNIWRCSWNRNVIQWIPFGQGENSRRSKYSSCFWWFLHLPCSPLRVCDLAPTTDEREGREA